MFWRAAFLLMGILLFCDGSGPPIIEEIVSECYEPSPTSSLSSTVPTTSPSSSTDQSSNTTETATTTTTTSTTTSFFETTSASTTTEQSTTTLSTTTSSAPTSATASRAARTTTRTEMSTVPTTSIVQNSTKVASTISTFPTSASSPSRTTKTTATSSSTSAATSATFAVTTRVNTTARSATSSVTTATSTTSAVTTETPATVGQSTTTTRATYGTTTPQTTSATTTRKSTPTPFTDPASHSTSGTTTLKTLSTIVTDKETEKSAQTTKTTRKSTLFDLSTSKVTTGTSTLETRSTSKKIVQTTKTEGVPSTISSASTSTTPSITVGTTRASVTSEPTTTARSTTKSVLSTTAHVTTSRTTTAGSSPKSALSTNARVTSDSSTTNPISSTPAATLGSSTSSSRIATTTPQTTSSEITSTAKLTSETSESDTTTVKTESTSYTALDQETVSERNTDVPSVVASISDSDVSSTTKETTTVALTQQPISTPQTVKMVDSATTDEQKTKTVADVTPASNKTQKRNPTMTTDAPTSSTTAVTTVFGSATTETSHATDSPTLNGKVPAGTPSSTTKKTLGTESTTEAAGTVSTETTDRSTTTTTSTRATRTPTEDSTVTIGTRHTTTTATSSYKVDTVSSTTGGETDVRPTTTSTTFTEKTTSGDYDLPGDTSSTSQDIKSTGPMVESTIGTEKTTNGAELTSDPTTAVDKQITNIRPTTEFEASSTSSSSSAVLSKETITTTAQDVGKTTEKTAEQALTDAVTTTVTTSSEHATKTETAYNEQLEKIHTTAGVGKDGTGTDGRIETTTTTEKESVTEAILHFEDLNMNAPVAVERDYCTQTCLDGFNSSKSMCFKLAPPEKSVNYALAVSYCQSIGKPRSNLASAYDFQDEEHRQLIEELLSEDENRTNAFVINAEGSAEFRRYRTVDLIALNLVDRFDVNRYLAVHVSAPLENINAVCRTTQFCAPSVCPMELFYKYSKQFVVGIPPELRELKAGQQIVVPCIEYKTGQTHIIRCLENGQFSVHPILVECREPEDFDEEIDTPQTPLIPMSCDRCYDVGTQSCTDNEDAPGVICRCKPGWTKATCWKSPDLCTESTCAHGNCVSLVDRTECLCHYGWTGPDCTVNATQATWFGTNETLAVFDIRSVGLLAQTTSGLFMILLKFLAKIITGQENQDPQDTYQDYRRVFMTVGGFLGIFFTHPHMFGVDAVGCRFFYFLISACYTIGLLCWVNESINLYTVCRATNKNEWNRSFDGEKKKYYMFAYRMIYPILTTILVIIAIGGHSWDTVGSLWNCFGSFSMDAVSTWFPLWALNTAMLLLAFAGAEGAGYLLEFRPHCMVRMEHWFQLNKPREMDLIKKVLRNRIFIRYGPLLHYLCWMTLSTAAEWNMVETDMLACILSISYAGFNLAQMVITDQHYFGKLSRYMICCLPKGWAPDMDWNTTRNRDEVLARHFYWRYKREQDAKVREEDISIAEEKEKIDEKNERLRVKYPNIPARLLYHCPMEGPAVSHPRDSPFDPSKEEYMTLFEREQLVRIWTRSYLDTRIFMKRDPAQCAFEVIKMELRRNCMQHKSMDRKKQELWLMAQWWLAVPGRDSVKLRAHERGVIMEDPDETPLLAFERAVSKLASMIDLRENRKRKRLLIDDEIRPFSNASAFIRFLPQARIRVLKCRVLNDNHEPVEKELIKKPDILIQEQIDSCEKCYLETIAEENESFNRTYDDDPVFTQWLGSDHETAAREILGVVPAQIGEEPISMNPRHRPLDMHWLDAAKPDFIGPRLEMEAIPLGPYGLYARQCSYYQFQLDAQWEKYERNAAILRFEEKIRRGEF